MRNPERKYSVGAGAIDGGEALVLAGLHEHYSREEWPIVSTVLIPQFQAQLKMTVDRFREERALLPHQSLSPDEISELCQMVDNMIEENRSLLDADGLFRPVMERINEVKGQVRARLGEQYKDSLRKVLAEHGITDRNSLFACGVRKFKGLDFGVFGKAYVFTRKILGRSVRILKLQDLEEIADLLQLPSLSEKTISGFKAALAVHDITDRASLLACGIAKFKSLDFGDLGRGTAFASKILGASVRDLKLQDLEGVADLLGWVADSPEELRDQYIAALAQHSITDRASLLACGVVKFKGLDFGVFGKGYAFTAKILGRSIRHLKLQDLMAIADALFPEDNIAANVDQASEFVGGEFW